LLGRETRRARLGEARWRRRSRRDRPGRRSRCPPSRSPWYRSRERPTRTRRTRATRAAWRARLCPHRRPRKTYFVDTRFHKDRKTKKTPKLEVVCFRSVLHTRASSLPVPMSPTVYSRMKSRIPNSVLPSHGAAGVGPFAPRGGKSPHPAVVALAVFAGFVFLVLCVVAPGTGSDDLDTTGSGNGRRLTQWLAPVWYSLPTLFDSLYNLVRPPRARLALPRRNAPPKKPLTEFALFFFTNLLDVRLYFCVSSRASRGRTSSFYPRSTG
jgi:hypothetical protein